MTKITRKWLQPLNKKFLTQWNLVESLIHFSNLKDFSFSFFNPREVGGGWEGGENRLTPSFPKNSNDTLPWLRLSFYSIYASEYLVWSKTLVWIVVSHNFRKHSFLGNVRNSSQKIESTETIRKHLVTELCSWCMMYNDSQRHTRTWNLEYRMDRSSIWSDVGTVCHCIVSIKGFRHATI